MDYEKLMRMKLEPSRQTYTRKDTMLYALGLGVGSQDPIDHDELKYVYERNLVALPTLAAVLAAGPMFLADPKYGVNYRMLLHGEQHLTQHEPLPVEGSVMSQTTFDEIYDKGAAKGAILYMTRTLYDETNGDRLVTMRSVVFLRGDGGFGGKSEGAPKLRPVPTDRAADLSVTLQTSLNQALIYRLSGDDNPLHSDPEVARSAGFERPILHGLCAYGIVGRALLKVLGKDDPANFQRLDLRFTSPVYPGEPLRLDVWKLAAGDAAFRLVAAKRNVVVQDFGQFEFAA